MLSKILNARITMLIASLILAFILYVNATSTSVQNAGTATGGQVYSATLKNLPVNLSYNSNEYFITGYTSSATVYLTSYNQIKLNQQTTSDMRTFSLSANLTDLGVGTHRVPIKINNLPTALNAQVSPTEMSVTIEHKTTATMTISAVVNSSLIPAGYKVTSTTTSPQSVTVTAGTNSIKNIARIEAVLPTSADLHDDFTGTVNLIAVNKNGDIVPAILSKSSVTLTIKVDKTSSSS
ncbi:MAG: hypothetical protein LBI43_00595 [Streptococcaceae bacterium]|jgi:YbbR domain-containing protein|nr:hypothetical protein [Streptococcaceae bacterium]